MQNFGGPPGAMYGGPGGGGPGGPGQQAPQQQPTGGPSQFPVPTGVTQMHHQQFKSQLHQFQESRMRAIQHAHQIGQINQQQFQQEVHALNNKIRQGYQNYVDQISQHQSRIGQSSGGGAGGAGGGGGQGQMPPPQMTGMTAAEKKKLMEMQKQRMAQQQAQQQQQGGIRFPPGTTMQQQHMMRMQYQQQQQQQQQQQNAQNQQQQGYPQRMAGPGHTPQYPGMQLTHQTPGMQQLQHMQPQTPQSHGPASVSNPSSQQQQQFQQQQYYQQQQQQQQQSQQQQQLHLQQQQQQQMQQQQQQHHQQQQEHLQQQQRIQQEGGPQFHQQQLQQQQQQQLQQQQMQQQQAVAPAPVAVPVVPAEKTEDIKYKELLREMKAQYLEVLQGMQRRQAQQKGLVQMVNILEGDRTVTYDHLLNLKSSLHRLMIRDCPTFPMMEQIRQVVFKKREDQEREAMATFSTEKEVLTAAAEKASKRLREKTEKNDPMGIEPWSSVKHLTIRVPEAIRKLTEKPLEEKKNVLKRARNETFDEGDEEENKDEMIVKRPKEEEVEQGDKEETASQMSVEEDISQIQPVFVIKTVFDSRKPWIIPRKAREELIELTNWNVDEHCLPSCSETPFIIICVKSPSLLVNPLRISLPQTYPLDPATVQFDRTFPQDSDYGPVLQKLFEKNLGTKNSVRNLTDFVEAYQAACEEYQVYIPKYQTDSSPESLQSQSQPTPDMSYSNHPRPAVTNPIAHKGIVM